MCRAKFYIVTVGQQIAEGGYYESKDRLKCSLILENLTRLLIIVYEPKLLVICEL